MAFAAPGHGLGQPEPGANNLHNSASMPMLVQAILPDNKTILSASLSSISKRNIKRRRVDASARTGSDIAEELTFIDLIEALLNDQANSAQLKRVFGDYYIPPGTTPPPSSAGRSGKERAHEEAILQGSSRDGTHWYIDQRGTRWGLQAVVISDANREWMPGEVERIGEGETGLPFSHLANHRAETLLPLFLADILPLSARLTDFFSSPLVANAPPTSCTNNTASHQSLGRSAAFSDFLLSSHLHKPRLRLIVNAPELCVRLRFAHVPEILEGWQRRYWFLPPLGSGQEGGSSLGSGGGATGVRRAATTAGQGAISKGRALAALQGLGAGDTASRSASAAPGGTRAEDLIEVVCEEMGVRRVVVQGAKSARVEYALAIPDDAEGFGGEEAGRSDADKKRIRMLPPPPLRKEESLQELLLELRSRKNNSRSRGESHLRPLDDPPTLLFTLNAAWLSHLGTVALGFGKHARKAAPTPQFPDRPLPSLRGAEENNEEAARREVAQATLSALKLKGLGIIEALAADDDEDSEEREEHHDTLRAKEVQRLAARAASTDQQGFDPLGAGSTSALDNTHTLTSKEAASAKAANAGAPDVVAPAQGGRNASSPQVAATPNRKARSSGSSGGGIAAIPRLSRMFEGWVGTSSASSAEESEEPEMPPATPNSARGFLVGSPNLFSAASISPAPAHGFSPTIGRSGKVISVSGPLELETGEGAAIPASPASARFSPQVGTQAVLPGSAALAASALEDPSDLDRRFEELMQDLGIKGTSRTAMLALPSDRKWFLIHQNDGARSGTTDKMPTPRRSVSGSQVSAASTEAAAGAGGVLADTWSRATSLASGGLHRFSMASITSWGTNESNGSHGAAQPATAAASPLRDSMVDSPKTSSSTLFGSSDASTPSSRPTTILSEGEQSMQAQKTGISVQHTGSSAGAAGAAAALWANWWGSGQSSAISTAAPNGIPAITTSAPNGQSKPVGGATTTSGGRHDPAKYAATLLAGKSSRKDLVKLLISLRVTLSSAKLVWIAEFLDADGLLAIEKVLGEETEALVDMSSRSKRKERKDMSDTVISECVKCLRTLMNTDVSDDELYGLEA